MISLPGNQLLIEDGQRVVYPVTDLLWTIRSHRGRVKKSRGEEENFEGSVIKMAISVNWGAMGVGAVVAFLVGWYIFGLLGAVIVAIVVMALMGLIKFT